MINAISYVVPFIGLIVCLIVVFTHIVDTKCPIRITKMALWLIVWTIVLFYDYPYDALKAWSIMIVRVMMLMLNIMYIIEAALYEPRKLKSSKK